MGCDSWKILASASVLFLIELSPRPNRKPPAPACPLPRAVSTSMISTTSLCSGRVCDICAAFSVLGDVSDINQQPGQRELEGQSGFEQSIGEIAGDDGQ